MRMFHLKLTLPLTRTEGLLIHPYECSCTWFNFMCVFVCVSIFFSDIWYNRYPGKTTRLHRAETALSCVVFKKSREREWWTRMNKKNEVNIVQWYSFSHPKWYRNHNGNQHYWIQDRKINHQIKFHHHCHHNRHRKDE